MENKKLPSLTFSNINVFYAIAKESLSKARAQEKINSKPKPNGELGQIKSFDKGRKGFKNALITIVFCGVCLEGLLHLSIGKRLGSDECKRTDRWIYKDKLSLLGCTDKTLLDSCKIFRECRREIVHEKAYFDESTVRVAQVEAERAMQLLDGVCRFLKVKLGE